MSGCFVTKSFRHKSTLGASRFIFCRSTVVFIYLVIFILLCVNVHGEYLSEFILSQISSGCVIKKKNSLNIAHCTKCDIVNSEEVLNKINVYIESEFITIYCCPANTSSNERVIIIPNVVVIKLHVNGRNNS